ncbi:MAG: ABC transporter substrate-binding protein [Moorellales bacterium]
MVILRQGRVRIVVALCVALVALISLSLTGCGGGKQEAAPSSGQAEPIVMGVVTALGSSEGRDGLRAVQLAAEEINAKGGVSVGGTKRPIEIVSIDTREHEAGVPVHDALAALEKLITEKKPHVIVSGAFRSEVLLASMDLIPKYKIPYIINIAKSTKFEEKVLSEPDKGKYFFRLASNSAHTAQYMSGLLDQIKQQFGFDRAYLVIQDTLWAQGTGKAVESKLKEQGWTVVGYDAYPVGASDFSASLSKAMQGKAQVIVPVFDMPQCAILVKQARAMKVPALIVGRLAPLVPQEAWDVFEGQIEGVVCSVDDYGAVPVKAIPKSLAFVESFAKKYGQDQARKLIDHGVGASYDAVYLVSAAIERAGSLDPDAIVAELEKMEMEGTVGKIKFGKDHQAIYAMDPKEGALAGAFQWKAPGVRVPVFPPAVAEGQIELPSYMK